MFFSEPSEDNVLEVLWVGAGGLRLSMGMCRHPWLLVVGCDVEGGLGFHLLQLGEGVWHGVGQLRGFVGVGAAVGGH